MNALIMHIDADVVWPLPRSGHCANCSTSTLSSASIHSGYVAEQTSQHVENLPCCTQTIPNFPSLTVITVVW